MVFSAELPYKKEVLLTRFKTVYPHYRPISQTSPQISADFVRACSYPTERITNTHVYDTASNMAIDRKTFSI